MTEIKIGDVFYDKFSGKALNVDKIDDKFITLKSNIGGLYLVHKAVLTKGEHFNHVIPISKTPIEPKDIYTHRIIQESVSPEVDNYYKDRIARQEKANVDADIRTFGEGLDENNQVIISEGSSIKEIQVDPEREAYIKKELSKLKRLLPSWMSKEPGWFPEFKDIDITNENKKEQ